jgi:hypothetical protein
MAKFKENSIGAIFQNRVEHTGTRTLAIWKNKDKWKRSPGTRSTRWCATSACSSSTGV